MLFYRLIRKYENKIKDFIYVFIYEEPKQKIFLFSYFIIFLFLKIFRFFLSSKNNEKIKRYYLSFWRINLFRHPGPFFNFCSSTLRVCITYKCNISCPDCYAKNLDKEFPYDMSLDDFIYLLKWAKPKGWKGINFLGGEPTIHPKFAEILDICKKENISVTLATNGLFDERILKKLQAPLIRDIGVNYLPESLPLNLKKQWFHNLEKLAREKFFLGISAEIDGKNDDWKKVVEIAERLKIHIRWSLLIPGCARVISNELFFSNPKLFGIQLTEILKTCAEKDIICFIYRPLPLCMFSSEQLKQIRKFGRYILFNRCMLGYRGDYTLTLTVNPDLSTYPCNSLFIKGPHINFFKDRRNINHYYEKIVKNIMTIPTAERCNNCRLFKNFLSIISNKNLVRKERLFDENVCQAGCLDFREYKKDKFSFCI